jgi:CRISPR/Cas system-associated protein endoribonuclease Cas2
MKMRISFYLFMLIGCLLIISGCGGNDDKKIAQPTVVTKKSDFGDPFRFHKLIEVSPGQDYDILSWGRGSKTDGAFLVLHSDSSGKKYTTTTGDLDGAIVDVYNSDMDLDGNPEILIQAKAKDTADYATIYAYEFNNGKANKLDFPKLTSSQRKGYHGNDNFYIKEGKFMREFPIYDNGDKDAKPTGAKRVLEYNLRSNNLTAKQLSKDSTENKTAEKAVVKQQVNASSTQKKEKTSKRKSKKQSTEKKTTKKKKHRKRKSSDDDDSN